MLLIWRMDITGKFTQITGQETKPRSMVYANVQQAHHMGLLNMCLALFEGYPLWLFEVPLFGITPNTVHDAP